MYIHYTSKQTVNPSRPFNNGEKVIHFRKNVTDNELANYDIYPLTIVHGNVEEVTYDLVGGVVTQTIPSPEPQLVSELTARQFRLTLLANGITSSAIETAISDNVADPTQREAALIEWEYANYIERNNTLVVMLGPILGKTEEELDDMFTYGSSL